MNSELVPEISESGSQSDPAARSTTDAREEGDPRQFDLLHQIALLLLRSNDIQDVIPDIARSIRDACDLHAVGIVLHDTGWMIQDDYGQAILPFPKPGAAVPQGEADHNTIRVWSGEASASDNAPGHSWRLDLFDHGQPVGTIFIRGARDKPLDAGTIDLLDRIGDMLVEASSRIPGSVDQSASQSGLVEVRQLLDVVSRLANLTDIDASIQPLLADIARLLNAELVSLIVSDPVHPEIFTSDEIGQTPPDSDRNQQLIAAPIVRLAVSSGKPQTGTLSSRAGRSGPQDRMLALPLIARGESIGILIVKRSNDREFTEPEREAAGIVADHLSFSLDRERRVRTYSRQNLLLSLVERVTAFIARSTDDDDLLARMAREIRRTFGYDCSIAMVVGNRLVFRALEVGNQELLPEWVDGGISLEAGVMGRVARTGQPAFVRNVRTDAAFLDAGLETVSEIAVPIRSGATIVGVLNVESGIENPLQDLDFEILLILANHIGIALSNRKLIASERETRMAIEAIQQVSTIVAEALDPEESLRLMAETLAGVLNYPVVTLALLEGRWLIRKANYGFDPDAYPRVLGIDEGISGRVARTGIPVLLEDVNMDPDYVRQREDLSSEICVPIRCAGEVVGILNVEGNQERPVTERDLHLLTTFAEHAGVLLNNARAYAELSREATLDPMTGVPNLRSFQQQLHKEFQQAEREGQSLSLAVIDLDDLKEINDSYGHLVGDQVLRDLARRMIGQLRDGDLLARYAGDEFVTILPGVDECEAVDIAERLLDAARREPFDAEGAKIELSLSIGVASYPDDASSSTELLRAADMAMYVAKESGKNRVSSARQSEHIRRRSKD